MQEGARIIRHKQQCALRAVVVPFGTEHHHVLRRKLKRCWNLDRLGPGVLGWRQCRDLDDRAGFQALNGESRIVGRQWKIAERSGELIKQMCGVRSIVAAKRFAFLIA
ncbi:MAG: hypothetical protein ACR65W_05955 [Methylocystis sp.]|uniref:hypothetical protein n=1 Tax=Methylocystis sp. TaxID=1911079 RepID=UPI003DA25B20